MIILGSDHAGFKYKQKILEFLQKQGVAVKDIGPMVYDAQDSYVEYAQKACQEFAQRDDKQSAKIILICGSGVGMAICANKNKGVRAVNAITPKQAKLARLHNNANCLCLGARLTSFFKTKQIVRAFLNTEFLGGKHQDRVNAIEK